MLLFAAVAALFLTTADTAEPNAAPPAPVRYVGETMSYSLHATMSQSIAGDDAFGRRINQTAAPTSLKLHERISITKTTSDDLGMHRLGSITAVVAGAKPVNKDGQGWTTINNSGVVLHDSGKLGGLFLLPLPFLADAAMHDGQELAVGDTWHDRASAFEILGDRRTFGRGGTRLRDRRDWHRTDEGAGHDDKRRTARLRHRNRHYHGAPGIRPRQSPPRLDARAIDGRVAL